MKRKRVKLDFFQVLEALSSPFFDDLEQMVLDELEELRRLEEYLAMRKANAIKAHRIYPRLKWLDNYSPWGHTKHIQPDFWGDDTERKEAAKILHERREMMRAFYRALYNFWMFDIPIPWGTKWLGLKYSRHRKYLLHKLKQHKRSANTRHRIKRRLSREQKKLRQETLASPLRSGEVPILETDDV